MAEYTPNELLERLGLSKKESAIYLALLQNGPLNISEIAVKTSIQRPLIYKELPRLLSKMLIVKTLRGRREYYSAEAPDKLEGLFEELRKKYATLMPELLEMGKFGKNKPVLRFLEGRKGITSVFEDLVMSLKRNDIYYRYSSVNDIKKMESYLPSNYVKIQEEKQLERYILTNQPTPGHVKPSMGREVKVLPKESGFFDFDILQLIYGEKVALVDFNSETAFVVENRKNAEFQKKIFMLLYHSLK